MINLGSGCWIFENGLFMEGDIFTETCMGGRSHTYEDHSRQRSEYKGHRWEPLACLRKRRQAIVAETQ
jgi:hypothetical protein